MKKLTRKQIVTIAVSAVVVIVLIIAGIGLRTKSNNNENRKDTDKKVESVAKEEKKETEKEVEVTEVVTVPETGHYEKVAGWVWFCTVCDVNVDGWTYEEMDAHKLCSKLN